jgi:hypothetical protein
MKTRFLLIRHKIFPKSFTLMEQGEDGQATGENAKFVEDEALALACDDLEQANHMEETYENQDCKAFPQQERMEDRTAECDRKTLRTPILSEEGCKIRVCDG